jgi:uncharacterized protein YjbI with pentapeptide repeats
MFEEVLVEVHGTLVDLLILGWLFLWLTRVAEKRQTKNRYRNEIEDFLGWKSGEATYRLAGNIRRLNRLGVEDRFTLTEAHLRGASLATAVLRNSDLWGADLEGAVLRDSDISGSNFAGANLAGVDLENSCIDGCDMRGANLSDADLERSSMVRVDLRGANLSGADLQYTRLNSADMERTTFTGANLHGADLSGADLRGATFEDANLRHAILDHADLRNVRFVNADLTGASLMGARLPEADILLEVFGEARSLADIRIDDGVVNAFKEARTLVERLCRSDGGDAGVPDIDIKLGKKSD